MPLFDFVENSMRELIDAGAGGYALVIIGLAAGAVVSFFPQIADKDKQNFLYLCSTTLTIGGTIIKPAEKTNRN